MTNKTHPISEKVVSALLVLLWAGNSLTAENQASFYFVVASDPQIVASHPQDVVASYQVYLASIRRWHEAVSHANRLKPDFMVVCGDLVNGNPSYPRDIEADEAEVRVYLLGAGYLDKSIPLYNVAGNHDVYNLPTPETYGWYEEHFGKLWYSFTYRACLFVVVESNVLKNPYYMPEVADAQMRWLDKTLAGEGFNHKFVFMHHPLYISDVNEINSYYNMPPQRRTELLSLFHKHGVRAVFSGHFHHNAYAKDGDLDLIVTSSSGIAYYQQGGYDPLGFRIVRVYPDRIKHAYYAYEDMPRLITGDVNKSFVVDLKDFAIIGNSRLKSKTWP